MQKREKAKYKLWTKFIFTRRAPLKSHLINHCLMSHHQCVYEIVVPSSHFISSLSESSIALTTK